MTSDIDHERPDDHASVLLDVAVDLVPLIGDVVELHHQRTAVVKDVAARWLALEPAEREATTLTSFVWDYVEQVDVGAYRECANPDSVRGEAAEQLVFHAWQRHVRDLDAACFGPNPEHPGYP